jgi:adenylylsulfate kinase
MRKILIMGLPGAGKTTLALAAAKRLNAAHFNADAVRERLSPELGFSHADRITHAERMGWMCDRVIDTGGFAIADFVCPTEATRAAFFKDAPGITVFVDRIQSSRFADTDILFERPTATDVWVMEEGTPERWADRLCKLVRPVFDHSQPTALMVGRYQPFHDGHRALAEEGIKRLGQVCIAVRHTHFSDAQNPFPFEEVRARIEHAMRRHEGKFVVQSLPNIRTIIYGREVGYSVEKIDLGAATEAISATAERARLSA